MTQIRKADNKSDNKTYKTDHFGLHIQNSFSLLYTWNMKTEEFLSTLVICSKDFEYAVFDSLFNDFCAFCLLERKWRFLK